MHEDRIDITREEREGFESAIAVVYNSMVDRTPVREASLSGKLYDVAFICDLIGKRSGTMSDDACELLRNMAARVRTEHVGMENRTYAAGARCLRALVRIISERP